MKNKFYLIFISAIIVLIILFVQNINLASGAYNSGQISWNYHGMWYSKGFSEYIGWKNFMDLFFSTVLGLQVVDVNGTVGLKIVTADGNEVTNTNLVSFDKKSGRLSYSINLTLPLIGIKNILYNISLNNEKNISKIVNTDDYYNKTLQEILLDLSRRGIKVSLIGEKSNITLVPNGTGKFEITYLKNINENDTEPINETVLNYPVNETAEVNTTSNNSQILNTGNRTESTNNTSSISLKILNPQPSNYRVYGFVGETKIFSVDNKDYDKLRWLLDGKLAKENSNFYDFYASEEGKFSVQVIIKKANLSKTNSWDIIIEKKAKETKGFGNVIIYLIIIIIIIAVIVIYILFRKKPSLQA